MLPSKAISNGLVKWVHRMSEALWGAAGNPDLGAVRAILDHGSDTDIEWVCPDGRTPLMMAVTGDQYDNAQLILQRGANPNSRDKRGYRAVHFTTDLANLEMLKLLVTHGADITQRNPVGECLLLGVVGSDLPFDKRPFIEFLMQNGASVDEVNNYGVSPRSFCEMMQSSLLDEWL